MECGKTFCHGGADGLVDAGAMFLALEVDRLFQRHWKTPGIGFWLCHGRILLGALRGAAVLIVRCAGYEALRRVATRKDEEGFLTAQADTFAGANVKRKGVGPLRSK